ncbi:MAG TPA: DUF2384 domain-containing protein [Hyphomicrobiaceae bacterium]|nr:DUF2384 domain-containing protein [Hyphomicrobiaceae bacterium]
MTEIASRSASEASRIAEFLGLPRARSIDDLALVECVRKGFPVKTASVVVKRIDPDGRFLDPTQIVPKSTLSRRTKAQQPLSREESERILAISRVFAEVLRIYRDDTGRSAQFLVHPHPLLGGETPMQLAVGSIAGAELVLKLLDRADAGVAV